MRVGIFDVTEVSPGRWKAINTLTTFEHVTYGTEPDVRAALEKQSGDWERRLTEKSNKRGPAGQRGKNLTGAPMKKNPIVGPGPAGGSAGGSSS